MNLTICYCVIVTRRVILSSALIYKLQMKYINLISLFAVVLSLKAYASNEIIKCFNSSGEYIEVEFGFKNLKSSSLSFKLNNIKAEKLRTASPLKSNKTYINEDFKIYISMNRALTRVSKINLTNLKEKKIKAFSSHCLSIEAESYKAKKIKTTTVREKKSKYEIFTKTDELGIIKLKLKDSPLDFRYDVLYYIPKRAKERKDLEAIVFLHGGGKSTTTRSTSMGSIEFYTKHMMKMARSLGVALVIPSATGLNWSNHTVSYLKEVRALIKSDMPVYDNRIGLVGHSMGAMAITRELPYLTDEFSFFLSMAGGAETKSTTQKMLKTYLNTSYTHFQGEADHIGSFAPRSIKQDQKVRALELELNKEIDFTLVMHKGGHNFVDFKFSKFANMLLDKVENKRINFYKKEVFGVLKPQEGIFLDEYSNGNHYFVKRIDSSFWIKATKFSNQSGNIAVEGKIDNQNVDLTLEDGIKELRIYLSNRMLDTRKSVNVIVNSKKVINEVPTCKGSDNYRYNCFVDIKL